MIHRNLVAAVAVLTMLPACGIAEGWYRVRGKVTAESAGAIASVPNATVLVRARRGKSTRNPTVVGQDGIYDETYGFGGMLPFAYFTGDRDPQAEFSAPGFHGRCSVKSTDAADGARCSLFARKLRRIRFTCREPSQKNAMQDRYPTKAKSTGPTGSSPSRPLAKRCVVPIGLADTGTARRRRPCHGPLSSWSAQIGPRAAELVSQRV
jgi:hypothetical protein